MNGDILSESEAAEALARANAATPGPWERSRNWSIVGAGHDWDRTWPYHDELIRGEGQGDPLRVRMSDYRVCILVGPGSQTNPIADGAFICAARTDVPALAASHELLRAKLAQTEADAQTLCRILLRTDRGEEFWSIIYGSAVRHLQSRESDVEVYRVALDKSRARVAVLEGALRRIAVLQDEKSENWFASELATEALAALDPADTPCAAARPGETSHDWRVDSPSVPCSTRSAIDPEKCRGCDRPAIGPHRFSCFAQGKQQISLPATVTPDGVMRVDLPSGKEPSDGE